jgi:ribose transport system ATP-binding protein
LTRRFRQSGQTIVFVSHRLDEVFALADDVSVLRDGHHVGTVETASVTHDGLIEMIVGRSLTEVYPQGATSEVREPRVVVTGLSGGPVVDASFEVREGEVLGIAGLLGSGRSELLQMLFGAYPRSAGTILLDGKNIAPTTPTEGIAAGVGFVPEDRLGEAIFADMTVRENMSAGNVGQYFKGMRLRHGEEAGTVRHFIEVFGVRPSTDVVPIVSLSGGNQQKVVLARWLLRRPALLLLEPTQGVDIGARSEIYRLVRQATVDGTAVVVVSSDFEELAQVCDRVIVLADGRLTREVKGEELTVDRLTELVLSKRVNAA